MSYVSVSYDPTHMMRLGSTGLLHCWGVMLELLVITGAYSDVDRDGKFQHQLTGSGTSSSLYSFVFQH